MAGQRKTHEMLEKIEAAGGADWLLGRVAEGATLISLAAELDVSRQIISKTLNSDEHSAALKKAREQAAAVLAEESLAIADSARPEDERARRLQIDTRRWIASKWDRAGYGDQAPSAIVDVRVLHLDALRRSCAKETPRTVDAVTAVEVTQLSPVAQ